MYDLGLPEPMHPLITITNFRHCTKDVSHLAEGGLLLNFFLVSLKDTFTGTVRYGQNYYDYDNGGLSFVSPNQLQASDGYEEECEGICLVFHPDFLKGYSLARTIKNYGYFLTQQMNHYTSLKKKRPSLRKSTGTLKKSWNSVSMYSAKILSSVRLSRSLIIATGFIKDNL
jgi:hypothetical protein